MGCCRVGQEIENDKRDSV